MEERIKVKIRGIYATALTSILIENGFIIVNPSPVIQERLGIEAQTDYEDIKIMDKPNKQGIIAIGERKRLEQLQKFFKDMFEDAIFTLPLRGAEDKSTSSFKNRTVTLEELKNLFQAKIELEFPYTVKTYLDEIRSKIAPTIRFHHQLKIIEPEVVEDTEKNLGDSLTDADEAGKRLKEDLIYTYFTEGKRVLIEHLKSDGDLFEQRGRVAEYKNKVLKIERKFSAGGLYDGLNLPKEEGDRGEVHLREGEWFIKRYYYSPDNSLKGIIYNLNTPVEFYPGRIRYVDLEVDIVKTAVGKIKVIDEEELKRKVKNKHLTPTLSNKIPDLIQEIMKDL